MKKNIQITQSLLILLIIFLGPVFSDDSLSSIESPLLFPSASHRLMAHPLNLHRRYEPQRDLAGYPEFFEKHNPSASGEPSASHDAEWHWSLKDEVSGWDITLFNEYPEENQSELWYQTKVTFGLALGVLGVIALLPESVSKWDKSEIRPIKKWWDNVKSGPVWDTDEWYINYIGHPYFGGVYYVMARSSGYNQWNSLVYSFLMSTFLYEYGIEAMCEPPSIQDIIVTPLGGWLYGEWAYQKKLKILENDSEVMGSKTLGSTALFLLDPVGRISQWVSGDDNNGSIQNLSIRLSVIPPVSNFSSYRKKSLELDDRYFGVEVFFNF